MHGVEDAMEQNAQTPDKLIELSPAMRKYLASVKDSEIENLNVLTELREEERATLMYLLRKFSKEDLEVIQESVDSLRSMKRFGKFGLWLFGFVVAGASAAIVVQGFFNKLGGPPR